MTRTTLLKSQKQDQHRLQLLNLPETSWGWQPCPPGLPALAEGFAPISLKQMDSVALLNRVDRKYVMSTQQLLGALAAVQSDYRILSVHGQRLNHYRTLYFDMPDFDLYRMHVTGRAERYKVRSREYTDSNQAFLEVKHKTRKDRTIKDRIPTVKPVVQMTAETESWLRTVFPYDSRSLEPKLWNTFTRLTLVNKVCCERVTLDVDLTFYAENQMIHLDGIAVAEVKMESGHELSPFLNQMRTQKIQASGFSKYCIGVSMLYDQVKKNTLKPKIFKIEKMTGGVVIHE